MCGRYVTPEQAAIERFWHIGRQNVGAFLAPLWNVAPTAHVPILHLEPDSSDVALSVARWSLIPHWWKEAKPPRNTHNARSEEAVKKAMWRYPLSKMRCLIPAMGWYEWHKTIRVDPATGEIKEMQQPHFFRLPDGRPFCFAGLMAIWTPEGAAKPIYSCAILTQNAIGPAAEVRDRMPIALPDESHSDWLDPALTNGEDALGFAWRHAVTAFAHHPVNPRVNNARNEGAELIEPIENPA